MWILHPLIGRSAHHSVHSAWNGLWLADRRERKPEGEGACYISGAVELKRRETNTHSSTYWHTVSSFNTQTESWTLMRTTHLPKSKLLCIYMHVRGLCFCLIIIFKMFTLSLTVLMIDVGEAHEYWQTFEWESGHHRNIIIRPSFLIPNIKPLWIIKWC